MTTIIEGRIIGTRAEVAKLVHRHPDQVRRRCTPFAIDPETGATYYDADAVTEAFRAVPRRVKLT